MKKIQKLQLGDLQLSKKEMKEVKGGAYGMLCYCTSGYTSGGQIFVNACTLDEAQQYMMNFCGCSDVSCYNTGTGSGPC